MVVIYNQCADCILWTQIYHGISPQIFLNLSCTFLQVVINEKSKAYNIDLPTDMHSSLTVTCLWPPQHQDAYTPVALWYLVLQNLTDSISWLYCQRAHRATFMLYTMSYWIKYLQTGEILFQCPCNACFACFTLRLYCVLSHQIQVPVKSTSVSSAK